jgi:hypothetical protein
VHCYFFVTLFISILKCAGGVICLKVGKTIVDLPGI